MSSQNDVVPPSPERLKEDVQHLKDWLSKEPHLPKIDDEFWLETFLHNNKYSLEKTKSKLENYYSLRTKMPNYLKNRNPTAPEILQTKEAVTFAVSDKLNKSGEMILYYKFNDASLLNMVDFTKRQFMVTDMMLLEHPKMNCIITLVDCDGINYQHIFKVGTGAGPLAEIFEKAYSERTKAIHLINAPSSVHLMTDVLKKYFAAKIGDRIYTHTPTRSTLFETLDENCICSDFGGKGPSLAKLDEHTQQLLEKYSKWFEEQEDVCSNELLRRKRDNQVEDLKGSFRKLEVD